MVDPSGKLVGIVSKATSSAAQRLVRCESTVRWLTFLLGPGSAAGDFVRKRGRKVGEVMTQQPFTVTEETSLRDIVDLMAKNNVKRLPVMRGDCIVGIVSRSNLLQVVAGLAREVPDPTADDDHIRDRIIATLDKTDWMPFGLNVVVHSGVVHLYGVITVGRSRNATTVAAENIAGVREVHDHLCWVEPLSGMYLNSSEDDKVANTGTFGR